MGNQANSKAIRTKQRPLPQSCVPEFTRVKQKGLLFYPKDPLQPKHVDDEGLAFELDFDEEIDPSLRETVVGSFHYKFNPECILRRHNTHIKDSEESKGTNTSMAVLEKEGRCRARSPRHHLFPYLLDRDQRTQFPSLRKARPSQKTESALLNDSAFAPIRRSTFNLTYSTLKGPGQLTQTKSTNHRRVFSQLPQALRGQDGKDIEIDPIKNQDLFSKLPNLDDTRIVETYRKLCKTRKNRSKSCISRAVVTTEVQEPVYNSFIGIEIDDMLEELIRKSVEASQDCVEKTVVVNNTSTVLGSRAEVSSDSSNCFESMIAGEEGSRMDEHNMKHSHPIFLIPKLDTMLPQQQREIQIPRIISVNFHFDRPETIFECTEENTDRIDLNTQEAAVRHADDSMFLSEEQTFANVEVEEKEHEYRIKNVKWIPNTFRQNRSDSLSTNENFSNKHSKNNSEDIQRPGRFRTLERKLEAENLQEHSEFEKISVRGKFVESFVVSEDEPEHSAGEHSFESDKPENIYQSNYMSPTKRHLQDQETMDGIPLTYRTELMFQPTTR